MAYVIPPPPQKKKSKIIWLSFSARITNPTTIKNNYQNIFELQLP